MSRLNPFDALSQLRGLSTTAAREDLNALRAAAEALGGALGAAGAAGARALAGVAAAAAAAGPAVAALGSSGAQALAGLGRAGSAAAAALASAFVSSAARAGDAWRDFALRTAAGARLAGAGLREAFGGVAGLISGLALTGIRNSAFGELIAVQWGEVGRQVGSLLLPQLESASRALQRLIGWFHGLTGEQQATYRQLLLTGAGLLAMTAALPRLVAGFQALGAVTQGARVALLALSAHPLIAVATAVGAAVVASYSLEEITSGLGKAFEAAGAVARPLFDNWLGAAKALGQAFRAMGRDLLDALNVSLPGPLKDLKSFTQWQRDVRHTAAQEVGIGVGAGVIPKSMEGLFKLAWQPAVAAINLITGLPLAHAPEAKTPRQELGLGHRGFESFEQTYRRIAEASVRALGGKSPQEEANGLLRLIEQAVKEVKAAVEGKRPAVGS